LLPAASQKLIYSKTWDNSLKQLARGNKNIDEVMELPPVKEEWDRLLALRENEMVNEKAAASAVDGGSLTAEEETPLSTMRRPPTDFKEHSMQYWKAVANTSVRRYITFSCTPATQTQMTRIVSQSPLKDCVLNEGFK
jgi:hypothetical protein